MTLFVSVSHPGIALLDAVELCASQVVRPGLASSLSCATALLGSARIGRIITRHFNVRRKSQCKVSPWLSSI